MTEVMDFPSPVMENKHVLTEKPAEPIPRPTVRGRHRLQPPVRSGHEGMPLVAPLVTLGVLLSSGIGGQPTVEGRFTEPNAPTESVDPGHVRPVIPEIDQADPLPPSLLQTTQFDARSIVKDALDH